MTRIIILIAVLVLAGFGYIGAIIDELINKETR